MREVEEGGDKGQWRRATTGADAGRSMVPKRRSDRKKKKERELSKQSIHGEM